MEFWTVTSDYISVHVVAFICIPIGLYSNFKLETATSLSRGMWSHIDFNAFKRRTRLVPKLYLNTRAHLPYLAFTPMY